MAFGHQDLAVFRLYAADELGGDGYPFAWHATIKHAVRANAGHRCIRCGHPYRNGEHGNGEWSPCDEQCHHDGPTLIRLEQGWLDLGVGDEKPDLPVGTFARWRILTVHHANGVKVDCRWWNLLALCQRCHLTIQGRVKLDRAFILEHSDWFKPYAAGWYAYKYLGEEVTREESLSRLDELLGLERVA